jgi:hypothetical protein
MGVDGQHHASAVLSPWKRQGTHCTGNWVDPRATINGCGKPMLFQPTNKYIVVTFCVSPSEYLAPVCQQVSTDTFLPVNKWEMAPLFLSTSEYWLLFVCQQVLTPFWLSTSKHWHLFFSAQQCLLVPFKKKLQLVCISTFLGWNI